MNSIKTFLFISIAALGVLLTGCSIDEICTTGEGSTESEIIALPQFTGVDLRISGNVYLTQGETQEVRVEGQSNIIEKLKLDVDDQVWKIDFEGCVRNHDQLDVYITLPELDYLRVGGSGNIEGQTVFTVDDVDLIVSGSGNIILEMDADHVNNKISGSGDMDLIMRANQLESLINGSGNLTYTGAVPSHVLDIRGSGTLAAFDLETQSSELNLSGSGDAEVFATESLEINITGSGDVFYKGTPALDIKVNGSGEVVDAN